MKFFLLAIISFVSSPVILHAQHNKFPLKDGKVFYEAIDSTVTDLSKSRLYNLSKLWVINTFKNPRVIQLDNPDDGMIVGATHFIFYAKNRTYPCYFSFNISSKDGKYRIQIYDLIISLHGQLFTAENLNKYSTIRADAKYIEQINDGVSELMLDLQNSIHHSSESINF